MATPSTRHEAIPVTVSPKAAAFFRSLSKDRRRLVELLLGQTLESAMSEDGDDLLTLVKKASSQARRRGLTNEALREIVNEE